MNRITKWIKNFSFFLLIALVFYGCCDGGDWLGESACLQNKIIEFSHNEACTEGASVTEYLFQGKKVYLFDPGNCGADFTIPVYDVNCNLKCSLAGFTGNTLCEGINFYDNAKMLQVLWHN